MGELFSYFAVSLDDFLANITGTHDNSLVKVRLAKVSPKSISILSQVGVNDSFYHVLDNFAVKHIGTKHTNAKEILRGQSIIQDKDFLLIPLIVSSYDTIQIESVKNKVVILYSKTCNDYTYCYIEELRRGRNELAGVTFYKRKKKLTDAKNHEDSADSGFASF